MNPTGPRSLQLDRRSCRSENKVTEFRQKKNVTVSECARKTATFDVTLRYVTERSHAKEHF